MTWKKDMQHRVGHSKTRAILLVTLAMVLFYLNKGRSRQGCLTYVPETCLLGDGVKRGALKCRPIPCKFDIGEKMECGFAETGRFEVTAVEGSCPDPFMTTAAPRAAPCGERCCSADLPGRFSRVGNLTGGGHRYSYQPVGKPPPCSYDYITRGQLTAALTALDAPLAIFGDSMMRQLFVRIVQLMRGQREGLLDYKVQTAAKYVACDRADAFRLAPSSPGGESMLNATYLREVMGKFYRQEWGPGLSAARRSLRRCTRRPIEIDYLFSPTFENQTPALLEYMNSLPSGVKPVLIVSVAFHSRETVEIPASYLGVLNSLRKQAAKIFLVSIPTRNVRIDADRATYTNRNAAMRSFARRQGPPFVYVDYDALSLGEGSTPAETVDMDKHFMCRMGWKYDLDGVMKLRVDDSEHGADADGTPLPQIPWGVIGKTAVTADGLCIDGWNENLAQVMFNNIALKSLF